MNTTERIAGSGMLQGSRAPSRVQRTLNARGAELWEQTGLKEIGAERVARGLGWLSIGLGLAELLAPRTIAKLCGLEGRHTGLVRLYGLREIAAGFTIFSQPKRPAAGVWSRVAGDAMDLATLGAAALAPGTNKVGVAFAAANVAAITAVDVMCAQELSRAQGSMTDSGAVRMKRSVLINRPAEEIYEFWRDPGNLPRFMHHLESVQPIGERLTHWVTRGPAGMRVEWDSEIVEDRPGELIAWRSLEGADVYNAGSVRFEPRPGGRGTIVRVEMDYYPPGGVAGAAFAMLFNKAPEQQIYDDLRRLKQTLETGEISRSDGSPDGTGQIMQHPGQPKAGEKR